MIVRLPIAILEVLDAGVEVQESLEQPVIDRERDQRPAGGIAVGKIAVLEQVVQDGSGFAAGIER